MYDERVKARVTNWNDAARPWKAVIEVDGYEVEKSFHATCGDAFKWCGQKKQEKQREMQR